MINEKEYREYGFDLSQGARYTGGGDDYELALKTFSNTYEKNEFELVSNFEMGQLVHYTTHVHSLKSNFRTIGLEEYAKLAERCESLGKKYSQVKPNEREKADFEKANDIVLQKYREAVEFIRSHLDEKSEVLDEEKIADDAAVVKLIDEFVFSCEDFDDDRAKELIKKIYKYKLDIIALNHIDMAKTYIESFEYEDAASEALEAKKNINI